MESRKELNNKSGKNNLFIKLGVLIIALAILGFGAVKIHLYTKIYCAVKECKPAVSIVTKTITFPEGYTVKQIFNEIASKTDITKSELNNVAKKPQSIGLPQEANNMLEGYLFPDTYDIDSTTTAQNLLSRMVQNTILHLKGVPKSSWNKTIILASMVEKEAKLSADRPKVARVFLNRISKGQLLQSDATVSYGTGNTDSVWTTDTQRNSNNGYNTYKRKGLPIGAICNPGESAINAAVNPSKGPWMFFVVVNLNTGETEFNTTSAGHAKSVAKLQQWVKSH
jgi:UPF0755 protein